VQCVTNEAIAFQSNPIECSVWREEKRSHLKKL
jgi:hypothetical protein